MKYMETYIINIPEQVKKLGLKVKVSDYTSLPTVINLDNFTHWNKSEQGNFTEIHLINGGILLCAVDYDTLTKFLQNYKENEVQ